MYGRVCGPMASSMPSLMAPAARPPDADDPPVLDADVRLDTAEHGIDDQHARHDRIEF